MSLFQDPAAAATAKKPPARYQAVSPLAVASVAMGALSILTMFGSSVAAWLILAALPLAGLVLGWQALKQIRKAPEEWIGCRLAWTGIGLAAGLWMFGTFWVLFSNATEVPPGYQWINFEMLQPDPMKPTELIPQRAIEMQDRKVYIKGYMQPRRRHTGIKDFILCPTSGESAFGFPNSSRTERIRIRLQGDLETTFTTRPVGIAGRFRVDTDDPSGIPYALDGEYVR